MYAQPSWTRRRHPRTTPGIAPRRSGSTVSREPYVSCSIWYATVPPKRELPEPGENVRVRPSRLLFSLGPDSDIGLQRRAQIVSAMTDQVSARVGPISGHLGDTG